MCLQNQAYQQGQVWWGQPGLCMPISSLQSLQALSSLTSPSQAFNSIPPPAAGAPLLLPPCTPEGKACQPRKQRGIEGQGASVMVLIISFRSMVLACQRQEEHSELCSFTDISRIITKKKSNFNATSRDHSHF